MHEIRRQRQEKGPCRPGSHRGSWARPEPFATAVGASGASAVSPGPQGLWKKHTKHLRHGKCEACVNPPDTECTQVLEPEEAEEDSAGRVVLPSVPLPPGTKLVGCGLCLRVLTRYRPSVLALLPALCSRLAVSASPLPFLPTRSSLVPV